MKYPHSIYHSEKEALQKLIGISRLDSERIDKPFHHKERVRLYPGTEIAKKYRNNNIRAINKTYQEANAHIDLGRIGVNVPKLFGILQSNKECSLFLQYINSNPLTSLLLSSDSSLPEHLIATGKELGKMFEYRFLHGDLTSYHILANGQVYLFDLEATRHFHEREFHNKLINEWKGFIDSTQGRRWKIPFTKEQEKILFEGVRENLSNKRTRKVLEKIILKKIR